MDVCMYCTALHLRPHSHNNTNKTNAAWWREKLAASLRISMSNE